MDKKIYIEQIIEQWVKEDEPLEKINNRYQEIAKIVDPMYDFILAFSNYFNKKRDYGNENFSTMIEIHILTQIYDGENVTVSSLAEHWKRTNSAISQIVNRLINKGLVIRKNNKEDRKVFFLKCTEKARKIVINHKKYDNLDNIKTRKKLLEKFSLDELVAFDNICIEYTNLLRDKIKN